jgi:hypothetical protein
VDTVTTAIAALPREQQSEWAELQHGAADPIDTLASWTPEHRAALRTALADYALSQTDARDVLRAIATWSRRLGVALACVVARESLRHVPADELRPLRAIETAERWTRGEATAEECRKAADAAYAARRGAYNDAASYAADAAAGAAHAAYVAYVYARATATTASASAARSAAAYAAARGAYARAPAASDATWDRARSAELRRLCGVIAAALRTGAVGEWLG